jgi:hypothetical protein
MQITAEIDIADILESLTYGHGDNDPINFIMAIDESMGDEGFTEELLFRLAQSYEKEYVSYEEAMTEKVLSNTFVEGTSNSPRDFNADLAHATTKREKLSKIVALIRSLDSDSNE